MDLGFPTNNDDNYILFFKVVFFLPLKLFELYTYLENKYELK